ncbi:MAG: valine--tRNA ligase, partial [Patescibacteria group bacterium]
QYGPFTIATARPETKFGDKYVVMHPDDKRYKKYKHGEKFECEWINGKVTATVIKDEAIDKEFGTGVMTITPYHDMTDFEIAERHKLPGEQIIDFNGKLLPVAGEFAGMEILIARPKIVEKLKAKGLLVKVEDDYIHRVAKGDRSNGLVEPQIKEQWFVDVNKKIPGKKKSLKELMREATTTGLDGKKDQLVRITPDRFQKIYLNWIDNLRDWCISRQIWWGHRIPVWYKGSEVYAGLEAPKGEMWKQDEDTLDTWFSSALWTFSTLGWPKKTDDMKTFHPSNWMQMGHEILFFWMARMILMSTYVLDEIPFKDVYIHGMLRDEKGKKFSKSAGNNIDPLDVIKEFGTDALRLSLLLGISPGSDSRYYEEKIIGARNFITKLWNISRYIEMSRKDGNSEKLEEGSLEDEAILTKLRKLVKEVTEDMENYRFAQAGEKLREFTWFEFADWYVEVVKAKNRTGMIDLVFGTILKLWHPFIPFVTEVIYEGYFSGLDTKKKEDLLIVQDWPNVDDIASKDYKKAEKQYDLVKDIISAIRNARSENKVEPSKKVKAVIYAGSKLELVKSQEVLIKGLRTGINELEILKSGPEIEKAIHAAVGDIEVYLIGAVDEKKEKERIKKEVERLQKIISGIEGRLNNEEFVAKAPKEVVEKEKEKLKNLMAEMGKLEG